MRRKSSIFAKRIYMDRDKLIGALRDVAKKLKSIHPEVESVILFGSVARGDYGYKSDADILLILKKSDKGRFFERISDYIADFDAPIPVDVLPYTKDEIERMKKRGLIRKALSEGIKLV